MPFFAAYPFLDCHDAHTLCTSNNKKVQVGLNACLDLKEQCHKNQKNCSKTPRYDIQVMLAIHQDEGPNQTKTPNFPKNSFVGELRA